jgi:hypothetical protein
MVLNDMRTVSTKAKGWQKLCWGLAQAGAAFHVADVTPKQAVFLQELCTAYRYSREILGDRFHLFSPSLIAHDINDEIEAELKRLLQKVIDSKKQPDQELMGMCYRYIALCLETENLSEQAIEITERILDVMEISVKR